jgi:hypothetical protein
LRVALMKTAASPLKSGGEPWVVVVMDATVALLTGGAQG